MRKFRIVSVPVYCRTYDAMERTRFLHQENLMIIFSFVAQMFSIVRIEFKRRQSEECIFKTNNRVSTLKGNCLAYLSLYTFKESDDVFIINIWPKLI